MKRFCIPASKFCSPPEFPSGAAPTRHSNSSARPWIHSDVLLNSLNAKQIPGVRFTAASFTPSEGLYKGETCAGVKLEINDGGAFDSIRTGLEIADSLHRLYPERFQVTKLMDLLASQSTVDALIRTKRPRRIIASWASDLAQFRTLRAKYLLYD